MRFPSLMVTPDWRRHLFRESLRVFPLAPESASTTWVIRGHVGLREKASASPLKADILRGG
jgi:hypothetical protein